MTLFTDYLDAKGTTRYQLAKKNNMNPSSFQRVKDTDNISGRILKIIAADLNQTPGQVLDDFIEFSNSQSIESDEKLIHTLISEIVKYDGKVQLNQLDSFNELVSAGQKIKLGQEIKQLAETKNSPIMFVDVDSSNHAFYQKR